MSLQHPCTNAWMLTLRTSCSWVYRSASALAIMALACKQKDTCSSYSKLRTPFKIQCIRMHFYMPIVT